MAGLEGPRKYLSYGALLLSAGASRFITWPLYVGVPSGDPPYVLSLQQESLVILRVGQLDSKSTKQNLPDLLRAKPGNVTESLHPVGQSRHRATPIQVAIHVWMASFGLFGITLQGGPRSLTFSFPNEFLVRQARLVCAAGLLVIRRASQL